MQIYLLFYLNLTWKNSNLSTWCSAFSVKIKIRRAHTKNFLYHSPGCVALKFLENCAGIWIAANPILVQKSYGQQFQYKTISTLYSWSLLGNWMLCYATGLISIQKSYSQLHGSGWIYKSRGPFGTFIYIKKLLILLRFLA